MGEAERIGGVTAMPTGADFLTHDSWLTQLMQRDAYNLNFDNATIGGASDQAGQSVDPSQQLKEIQSRPVFITAKVATSKVRNCQFLEDHGFRLVDTNVRFAKDCETSPEAMAGGNLTLRKAVPTDRDAVINIASRSFRFSRFHLDPNVPVELANRIKGAWASNFFDGKRGDEMVVAEQRGKVIGFAQLFMRPFGALIDLIAVDADFQRQGAAAGMLEYAETLADAAKISEIAVGTQIANVPSVRLYEKLGFRVKSSQYVFHYHNT